MSVMEQTKTSTRQVPFFNYSALFEQDREGLTRVMLDVCSRGAYIMQRDLREFEEALAKFSGAKHAIGIADGTNAILLGLRALELPAGSEVIMASHTYVATANSAYFAGLVPVPVDCGSDHMIGPAAIEQAITPKTRGIMPTQLNGRCADMDAIGAIAKKHNLIIAEDAAQALGARFKGIHAGLFGAFGTISFYPAKVLGCFGDGGAVLTNDDKVAAHVRMSRDHGRNDDGEFVMWGTNARLDNLHAAVLNYKLKTYGDVMERRRAIASRYQAGLGDLKELHLPPAPDSDPRHFDIFQNYEIEADRRDQLKDYLKEHGVGSIIQWAGQPLHKIKALGIGRHPVPKTDRMFERCLMLPIHMAMSDADVDYVIDTVRAFYGRGR
jgi:dTDP-4-amino-4,6-dideoxygalactose transaminase